MSVFRLYAPDELGADGYPPAWHRQKGTAPSSIKVMVRLAAGNRCVRCGHPYEPGEGEWSACDERCMHGDERRFKLNNSDEWQLSWGDAPYQPTNATAIEARWRILTVHHLDGNKANCRWWNLVALCQRCHLQIQGRVQMARVWPWEHSDWFKPYVAGYYALTYLGQELDREQTEARLDELLGLELAA